MGIAFQIVDQEHWRAFDLGKGFWGDLPLDRPTFEQLSDFVDELMSEWSNAPPEYRRAVARRIWAFCEAASWNVTLRNDETDYDDEERGAPPIVASRFDR